MRRQTAEVCHAEDVELRALAELDPVHRDPLELAREHRELPHAAEVEGEGLHGVHADLRQVEAPRHSHILDRAVNKPSRTFTITEKAPTSAFCLLTAPTSDSLLRLRIC